MPWVARLRGLGRGRFEREFVERRRDYREAPDRIVDVFVLAEGEVYEAYELVTYRIDRRFFVCVVAGRAIEIGRDEAMARVAECARLTRSEH